MSIVNCPLSIVNLITLPAWCVVCPFGPTFFYWDVSFHLVCRPPAHLRVKADVGSSKGLERQPTCRIRAGHNWVHTAKAGCMGSILLPMFFYVTMHLPNSRCIWFILRISREWEHRLRSASSYPARRGRFRSSSKR